MGSKKKNNIKVTPESVLLTDTGYLRLSYDLLPKGWGPQTDSHAFLLADPIGKKVEIQLTDNGKKSPWPIRRVVFSNSAAKSPHISVREVLKVLGVPVPKKSTEYKVHRLAEDKFTVQF
jgi:hypothetical protein